jgi:hypothetical protein
MRFLNFVRLQITTKASVSLDLEYLKTQGFKFKNRALHATIDALLESKLIELQANCQPTVSQLPANSEPTASQLPANSEPTVRTSTVTKKGLTSKSGTKSRVEKSRVYVNKACVSIFDYWNTKEIMIHRDSSKYLPSIGTALKSYSEAEIIDAINNYKIVLDGPEFWLTMKWTLKEFITRGLEKCLASNKPFESYKARISSPSSLAQTNRDKNGVCY